MTDSAHALTGGLWLHRFRLNGEPMAHLVSADRDRLVAVGQLLGMKARWLQDKPLKHPDDGQRYPAWHWDLLGRHLERVGPPIVEWPRVTRGLGGREPRATSSIVPRGA